MSEISLSKAERDSLLAFLDRYDRGEVDGGELLWLAVRIKQGRSTDTHAEAIERARQEIQEIDGVLAEAERVQRDVLPCGAKANGGRCVMPAGHSGTHGQVGLRDARGGGR